MPHTGSTSRERASQGPEQPAAVPQAALRAAAHIRAGDAGADGGSNLTERSSYDDRHRWSGRSRARGFAEMRFFSFHLMPYPALPDDYDGPAWGTCPHSLFDPGVGTQIYNRYLDELILAEDLGFDGVCVNQHHRNAYAPRPSPHRIGSVLARQTS